MAKVKSKEFFLYNIYIYIYIYIERERERERETERQTDRQTDRETDRQTDRQIAILHMRCNDIVLDCIPSQTQDL